MDTFNPSKMDTALLFYCEVVLFYQKRKRAPVSTDEREYTVCLAVSEMNLGLLGFHHTYVDAGRLTFAY